MSRWIVVGAASMAIGIALGAFGAHALRDTFDARQMEWWTTAQHYQVWHALGLLLVGLVEGQTGAPQQLVGWLILAGTVLFSGSLYLMALTKLLWLGAVTPFGGLCFIAGWAVLAVIAYKSVHRATPVQRP
ncbi:MAG TPA: DUF423 domain-containing protein [Fimbriimonadaceae bacterium]|nr:DUF423 domain-containing protein [Fimbriimonadaceae bacterium]